MKNVKILTVWPLFLLAILARSRYTTYMKAIWNNQVLAESDSTVEVEGNQYFPPDSVNRQFFMPSDTHTTCPWKGEASYYTVVVDGETNADAAWFYPEPKEAASHIKGHVAFWKGVEVTE